MQALVLVLAVAMVILMALLIMQQVRHHRNERFTTPTTDVGVFAHAGNTPEEIKKKLMYRQI